MKNKFVKDQLIALYGYKCWLLGEVSKRNKLTLHHIKPVRENGATTIDNGALLTREMHDRFNILEQMYPELANEINIYLQTYKGNYSDEVLERINRLLELVKRKEKTTGGKVKKRR